MPPRLAQASVAMVAAPVDFLLNHLISYLVGYEAVRLLTWAIGYVLVAATLALAVVKRKRLAWYAAIVVSGVVTIVSVGPILNFLKVLFVGHPRWGWQSAVFVIFIVTLAVSGFGALALLLTPRARQELRET
jgi:hypothetical protein